KHPVGSGAEVPGGTAEMTEGEVDREKPMYRSTTPARRLPLPLIALVLGGFCLGARPGPVVAQDRKRPTAETIRQAGRVYRADRLLPAEALYKSALAHTDGLERRHCLDRLLAIYVRVGRQDQAIRTGEAYARWLRRIGDLGRARELDLDLGRWYLALGHCRDAQKDPDRALADGTGGPPSPAPPIAAPTHRGPSPPQPP